MSKLYNTQEDFAINFNKFVLNIYPKARKTQLNILPYILFGMTKAESSVASDIARELEDKFDFVQHDSNVKRIRRFYNNKLFDGEDFYDALIKHVIFNYKKKHKDFRVHIIIDHMFSHDNYTTLMMSMRVGKQGIPLWFKSFKGKKVSDAFEESLIMEGINYIIDLFKHTKYKLTFLADRWFNSTNLMKTIEKSGHIYCFRLKKNIKCFIYDKKEGHKIWKWLDELTTYEWHSALYDDVLLTESKFKCKIVCSKRHGTDDAWILATNGNYRQTIIDYGYRFGGIETIFKNQKSNGFYIENIVNATEKSYQTMYALVCTCILFHTIIGTDYSKNTRCYKNIKIVTHKKYKSKGLVRVLSLFNTGLTLFKRAINSRIYIRIPMKFILYDI